MDTRERLISSATTLLTEEGVDAVTLRGIAKATGVSHGAPLRHFAGRAQLLSAVASNGFEALRHRFDDVLPGPPRERLLAACRSYVEFSRAAPSMFALMFRHDLLDHEDPVLARLTAETFDSFGELVAAAQHEGWRVDTDAQALTAALWSALYGVAELGLWGGTGNASLIETLETTLEAFFG
ncbi:DNA-binding transcriptional regulator, AcrR family [Amycolatopsis xylanica]|uniref:DNA-binding transcriptional regulator, AcrR family n=1 Tax=Amycolatopsis xylanica TaxID=589385 RepID=A0A1H3ES34_9PSEU|nr:TetR/AcrR family transcriptional regulator [Amycolatopsis xylanica]SDX81543.1 DNA-binding transcriptional regulator, AcrR family [Amycolatopsis xylanica]